MNTLLIENFYPINLSKCNNLVLNTPNFTSITDLSLSSNIQLNMNVELTLINSFRKYNIYTCSRRLNDIVITDDSTNLHNTVIGKQPTGFNPILIGLKKKIYRLYQHFNIVDCKGNYYIVTTFSGPLLINFCTYFNGVNINTVSNNFFGNFLLLSGNPSFAGDKVNVSTLCVFKNITIDTLMNKTVYIVLGDIKINSVFTLSDSVTNIKLANKFIYITGSSYTSVPLEVNDFIIVCCTITESDISLFSNINPDIPKSGAYNLYLVKKWLILNISYCSMFCIEIYDTIHKIDKIRSNINTLTKYI